MVVTFKENLYGVVDRVIPGESSNVAHCNICACIDGRKCIVVVFLMRQILYTGQCCEL